ncbi:putative TFIIIC transcription initiation factor complex subunits Tfc3 [Aspergillus affinis]|uniref:putative TFIIIC transcription initiation factor complex subunits Tfc3 n=1 Tax=Aspergillus affinis TaxID=1070780 RepID=UPI0022FE7454|nr:uncharacterized protein KD926_009209 [Aspergillus affinis]KAI9039617.1 hypothetical protein KD926_009209 [Aspergillus affinis]
MAPSLRDLIDFLLAEIALCGDQGATPADILKSVNTFYEKAAQDASERHHSVDRRFQEKVWSWLTRNPEVSVGNDREGNHLTLDEAEGRGQINQETEEASPSSSRDAVRVFVSEERTWLAITGHERDDTRVFSTEFALLSIIAARREKGIFQTDLVKLSGQDKRSVPKRTELLHQKGYIDKRAVQFKSVRTSLCTLRKFVTTDVSPLDAAAAGQQSNGQPQASQVVDYKEFTENLFGILEEYKIIGRNDLKNILGFADRWRWRILSRALRKCERLGLLKRVKALTQYADTFNKYHPCVLLIRHPTKREFEMLNEFSKHCTTNLGHEDNVELDEDIDPNDEGLEASSLNEPEALKMVKREEDMEEAGRMIPTWTPDRNIHNQIFEAVDKAGTPGITNIDIIRTCFGGFFRRPLENALGRLVACWQLSQPLHLRHLAIVRDTALRRTITHYVHYSANNFRKLVDAEKSTWEAVEYKPKSTKGADLRVPPVDASPELDEYGFSIDIPRKELLRHGNATLLECMLSAKPSDYSCTSTDLKAMQIDGDTYGIHYGQKYLEVSHPDKLLTPKRPRATRRDKDVDMEDSSAKVVSVTRPARKKREDASRFIGMSEKEKLEALGLDETWTEYSVLLIERSQPGVYVTPRGRRRPAGKRQGRPRISRIAVFRSPKLGSFPWFVKERKDGEDEDEDAAETRQSSRSESVDSTSGTTPAVVPEDQPLAHVDGPTETPNRGTRANLRRRASFNEELELGSGRSYKQRRLNGTTAASPTLNATSDKLAEKRGEHEEQDESTPARRSKRRRVESPVRDTSMTPIDKANRPEESPGRTPSKETSQGQKSRESAPATDGQPQGLNGAAIAGDKPSENATNTVPTNGVQPETPPADVRSHESPAAEKRPVTSQAAEEAPLGKIPEKGGSVNVLRRKIILDILQQAGGVFPMGSELWCPFTLAWNKLNYKGKPDLRTIKKTVKHMVDAGKLRQHTFSGRDSKGVMVTKSIISKTDLQPDAPIMKDLQRKMLAADPRRPYIPEGVEFDREMSRNGHGRRSTQSNDPGLLPRRPPIEQGITVQLHQKPGFVLAAERRKGLNIERRLFRRLAIGRDTGRKPPRLMKISRRSTEDSLQSLTSITRPEMTQTDGDAAVYPQRRRRTATSSHAPLPPGGSIPRRRMAGRLSIPLSAMAPYAMVMNPKQTYHAGSGTYATHAGIISLQIPKNWDIQSKQPEVRDENEHESDKEPESEFELELDQGPVLPKSLDDIFNMTRRRVMDYTDKEDPRSRRFFLDNRVILRWELQNEDLLRNQTTEDLRYINQTVSDLFSTPIQGNIRFDNDEPKPPARPPPEPKTTRQAARRVLPAGPAMSPPNRQERELPRAYKWRKYDYVPQNRRLNKLLQGEATASAASASHSSPPSRTIRRNRVANQLPEVLVQKIMTAIVVIRTLASGHDARLIDWNIFSYCFPDQDPAYIQERARVILNRMRLPIAKMQSDFQELYLDAYEHGRVPPINYDDLENYDWEWIVDWAAEQLEVPRSEKLPYLPATREEFDGLFDIREEAPPSLDDIYQTSYSVTVQRRRTLCAGISFAIPVANKPAQMTARQAELARLDVAKSWVRANVITPEEAYNAATARHILSQLGEKLVDQALQSLITERVLCTGNKGRVIPGRNYDVTEHFLHSLGRKRAIEATELRRAAQFKTEILDPVLQKQGVFDVSYSAEDGDILALINLYVTGRVMLQPRDPPRDKYGLTDGGYLTRLIDKQKLRFPVEVRPVKGKYIYGDPIEEARSKTPAPQLPVTDFDTPNPVFQKVPLWYDIHGNFVAKLWELALAAVVGCVATRPGISASGIASMMKPSLGAWEIELILEWMCQNALCSFEAILTNEQKNEYHASAKVPDAASVIQFVAQIDASNGKTSRRCVAPRLCTLLEATQQFSGIVDTFVSSNPTIAALVWGGVKTAILTANNVASYFDKVTTMIMAIGKTCPTYQQFGPLYPGCVDLQRVLCDYYAIIIRLCTRVIEITRRPAWTQTVASIFSPFEFEFKPFLDDLEDTTKNIRLQILLESQKADRDSRIIQEHESQENAKFRPFSIDFYKRSMKHHAEEREWRMNMMKRDAAKLRSSIRDNLSTINHVKPWKQAFRQRIPDTAEWLLKETTFCEWRDSSQSAFLWCSGTMGVGKTVLASNVVAHLHASQEANQVISYYFCRSDIEDSLSTRNILGSLARQMLDSQIERAEDGALRALLQQSENIDTPEVIEFLIKHLGRDKKKYIILDGLDECDSKVIREVAGAMAQLCKEFVSNVKILWAGRPDTERQFPTEIAPHFKILMAESKVKPDIDLCIDTALSRCLETNKLKLGDPRLILEISNTLRDKSNGMFLWTCLCIEELCDQNSDDAILEALTHLPQTLSEIFDRKLRRAREKATADIITKLLQFCGVVKRPLTLMEYQEFLSLAPKQKSLNTRAFSNDMDRLVNDCCGLVSVDEEESTVHYIHHSVKQHLFPNKPCAAGFDWESLELTLGLLCMTYLNFDNFKGQLTKYKKGSSTHLKPFQLGAQPVYQSNSVSNHMAQKLLSYSHRLQRFNSVELEKKSEEIFTNAGISLQQAETQKTAFQFLDYAKYFWFQHLSDIDPETHQETWILFCQCVERLEIPADRPWEAETKTYYEEVRMPKEFQWSLAEGHFSLFLCLAERHSHLLTDLFKHEALLCVTPQDRYGLTRALLQLENNTDNILNHALFFAAQDGCEDSVASLLQAGADTSTECIVPEAPNFRREFLRRLPIITDPGRDPNQFVYYECPLVASAEGGHTRVVEMLIEAKADVNAQTVGCTALCRAAKGGHKEVVERLIEAGADVNVKWDGQTALWLAVQNDHLETVETLLGAGADVNVVSLAGWTALKWAITMKNVPMVERLVQAGADFSFELPSSGTVPSNGLDKTEVAMVKILQQAEGDLCAESSPSRAELLRAIKE